MGVKSRKLSKNLDYANRKALIDRLETVEDKLLAAQTRALNLEAEKIQLKEREIKLKSSARLEKTVFTTYAKILRSVEAYEGRSSVNAEEELKNMLSSPDNVRKRTAFGRSPEDSPRSPRDDFRSFGQVGSRIATRVENAFNDAQALRALHTALDKNGGEINLMKRITNIETERDLLKEKLKAAEKKINQLEQQTSTALESHYILDKRRFKHAILEILADLSSAIERRLGFIPRTTRTHINNFMQAVQKERGRRLVSSSS
uniref:Uncharacterized protein n=1 Tax=Aureoumbra lagunensis TaxID=44058 RepID=A0A7S3JUE4_9STRA|mmetsp:Transcript_11464/g.15655  ORF Transcript_11464/g.15655 Transcript_11464/m.15655 type:complete len:260 (-) Transcript_11464:25-804(-)